VGKSGPHCEPRAVTTSTFGPDELGRGVVIAPDALVPAPFGTAPAYRIDQRALTHPEHLLQALHGHWARRERVVLELSSEMKERLKQPESLSEDAYRLSPSFEFSQERLHFLTWANNVDATGPEPIWWHARLAQRLGASASPQADIDLDGPVWCDGGPRGDLPFPVLHRETIKRGKLDLTMPCRETSGELATDQTKAVLHRAGAARILAPAGSGKTRVLTHRLAHILSRQYLISEVTAVAYNRRAALEMQQRLGNRKLNVRTLHSLGYAILRRELGVQVASAAQVRGILRGLVKVTPQLNTDPYQPYIDALQQVRLGLQDPKEVEARNEEITGFAEMFGRYREKLAARRLVDHDEQIYGAIELLLRSPAVRKRAQAACTHLLVDEFQDLTPAFLLLLRLLSAPGYQLFAVGDDDQVIYGYAGATPEYLVDFDSYFPHAAHYQLETNYRCPGPIVLAAARLLDRNQVRVPKDIHVTSKVCHEPELLLSSQQDWTAGGLAWIKARLKEYQPEEIAVLSRVNALLLPLQVALQQEEIPHTKVVDESILERTGVRSALAYWRICRFPQDMNEEDLADALRRPNRKLKREYIERACRCRDRKSLKNLVRQLDAWPASQIEEFLTDLTFLGRQIKKGPARFFQALRQETQFLEALDQLDSAGLGAAGSSHSDDLLALEQLARRCEEEDFEEWLRNWLSAEPTPGQGIRLSSVHRVKGLEWPCVLIFGAEAGLFPHRLSDDIEEERRILHVALTRTIERCAIVASPGSPSPFLKEMRLMG
jgi:ATP-dependent DNA helicase UvrD/PcrA